MRVTGARGLAGYDGHMKRFTFRYQTLLEVRERTQHEEEEKLQYHLAQQRTAEGELSKLYADEQDQRDAWLAMQSDGTLKLDEMAMINQFMTVLERRIGQQKRSVEDAIARTDNQRELLTEAMRAAEIIRKLKERDQKTWRDDLERSEAAELDEIATLRYAYNKQRLS
jgi:flagellar export protein FliJ